MLDIPNPDEAKASRLKQARKNAGFRSASGFARRVAVNVTTYHHHENGRRAFDDTYAELYARALNVGMQTLLYGEELQRPVAVPIVGLIGAGGKVIAMDSGIDGRAYEDEQEKISFYNDSSSVETVVLPDPSELLAMRVIGESLYPAYRDGDVVLFKRLIPEPDAAVRLHGIECVVEMTNGNRLIRQITAQPDGRATLIAYAAQPTFNVSIVAASPVEMVRRNLGGHR